MSSWSSLVAGTGAGPAWWSGLVSTRSPSARTPPDGASGAETAVLDQAPALAAPVPVLGSGGASDWPQDLNRNGQWDTSEIELWQAHQDSGRLAWLLIMVARAQVDRLRSQGGSVVTADKSLRQAHQSFEQGDFSRAMALAGRAQSQARRAQDQQKIREKLEKGAEGQPDRPDDPRDPHPEDAPGRDRADSGTYLERLWGLANQARQMSQRLAERPPAEYVERDV